MPSCTFWHFSCPVRSSGSFFQELNWRNCEGSGQGWTLAPACPPMAGNFHGGQVKFQKYQPGWQAPFPKSYAANCYGQVKDNFGLVAFQGYQPDWLVPEKCPLPATLTRYAILTIYDIS